MGGERGTERKTEMDRQGVRGEVQTEEHRRRDRAGNMGRGERKQTDRDG